MGVVKKLRTIALVLLASWAMKAKQQTNVAGHDVVKNMNRANDDELNI